MNERRRQRQLAQELERREPAERGLSHKRKCRRYCDLSTNEVISIAHAALIQLRFHRDVAEEFGVSIDMVRRIARKGVASTIEER